MTTTLLGNGDQSVTIHLKSANLELLSWKAELTDSIGVTVTLLTPAIERRKR